MQPLILDHPLQPVVEQQGEGEGGKENAGGDRQRPGQPAGQIADEGGEDDQRRGDDADKARLSRNWPSLTQPRPTASCRTNGIAV